MGSVVGAPTLAGLILRRLAAGKPSRRMSIDRPFETASFARLLRVRL
jgi:hypothetical protein